MSDLIKRLLVNSGEAFDLLLEAAAEIERLTAEVKRLDYSTTHTCWDECPRVVCAQRREIEALTAQIAEARESERAAVVAWLEASAAWHEQHDDGLSGFDGIRQGQFEAMQAIKAGEHLT